MSIISQFTKRLIIKLQGSRQFGIGNKADKQINGEE